MLFYKLSLEVLNVITQALCLLIRNLSCAQRVAELWVILTHVLSKAVTEESNVLKINVINEILFCGVNCANLVNYVQSVADVDDPLLERAAATGQDWEELAEDQTELFRSDMTALRVIPPDRYIGAVESIPCVVELIEKLLPTGLVYQVEDPEHPDWYFNTADAPDFGEISHYDEERMLKIFAERGGDPERPGKRHPLDCLLWRFSRPGEPSRYQWARPRAPLPRGPVEPASAGPVQE